VRPWRPSGPLGQEAHDMPTIRSWIAHGVPLVGIGLMLAGLFGGPALPAASAAAIEPFASPYEWGAQHSYGDQTPWGPQDYWRPQAPWGYRHNRPYQRPRHALPDHYTIRKGKKCEVQCERIRGTRDYRCREYRC
jgi:hypothetical protein